MEKQDLPEAGKALNLVREAVDEIEKLDDEYCQFYLYKLRSVITERLDSLTSRKQEQTGGSLESKQDASNQDDNDKLIYILYHIKIKNCIGNQVMLLFICVV